MGRKHFLLGCESVVDKITEKVVVNGKVKYGVVWRSATTTMQMSVGMLETEEYLKYYGYAKQIKEFEKQWKENEKKLEMDVMKEENKKKRKLEMDANEENEKKKKKGTEKNESKAGGSNGSD